MRERNCEFLDRGVEIVVVLGQRLAGATAWFAAHPVPFRVVLDGDRSLAKAWGVYVRIGLDSLHMARPASFLVDPGGMLAYARISKHQLDPAPLDDILAAVG